MPLLPHTLAANRRCLQAKERGTVRPPEPQVDKVDAQDVLPVLLRTRLPHSQPGLPLGGRSLPHRSEARTQRRSQDEGGSVLLLLWLKYSYCCCWVCCCCGWVNARKFYSWSSIILQFKMFSCFPTAASANSNCIPLKTSSAATRVK